MQIIHSSIKFGQLTVNSVWSNGRVGKKQKLYRQEATSEYAQARHTREMDTGEVVGVMVTTYLWPSSDRVDPQCQSPEDHAPGSF